MILGFIDDIIDDIRVLFIDDIRVLFIDDIRVLFIDMILGNVVY